MSEDIERNRYLEWYVIGVAAAIAALSMRRRVGVAASVAANVLALPGFITICNTQSLTSVLNKLHETSRKSKRHIDMRYIPPSAQLPPEKVLSATYPVRRLVSGCQNP